MTNQEYIRQLDIKSLAELLVQETSINEGDESIDGEWYDFYMTCYISPDGGTHCEFEDAVEDTVNWLNSERNFSES